MHDSLKAKELHEKTEADYKAIIVRKEAEISAEIEARAVVERQLREATEREVVNREEWEQQLAEMNATAERREQEVSHAFCPL